MQFRTSDNLTIRFSLHGNQGDIPLVLLHGIGADRHMWEPQIRTLPSARLRLIVPDLRGHGESDRPERFQIQDCSRDIKELLDNLQIQRAHLVGVSMGGMIAQQFAVDYPDRTLTLVLVDSLSGISRPLERFNAALAALLLKVLPPKIQAQMIQASYRKMGHPAVGAYFQKRLLAMDQDWLLKARLEVNRFDIFEALPGVKTATLVLVGDGFGKLALQMARATAERIPGAAFQVLEGGGDPSNLLVPDQFDSALIDFLKRGDTSTGPDRLRP